jgi:hypothetical protein
MATNNQTGSLAGLSGPVVSKAVGTVFLYQNDQDAAITEYAATKVATRFRLTISTAREVCRMAGLAVPS